MTNCYLKSKEFEVKLKSNVLSDDEKQKKNEEDEDTKKMTLILKQMNSPRNMYENKGVRSK